MQNREDQAGAEPPLVGPSRHMPLKIAALYFAFGTAYYFMMEAYCVYRAQAGSPSDLPCFSLFWGVIGLGGSLLMWPLMAMGDVLNGHAVLVPGAVVRLVGITFLAGFAAAAIWLARPRRPRKP